MLEGLAVVAEDAAALPTELVIELMAELIAPEDVGALVAEEALSKVRMCGW